MSISLDISIIALTWNSEKYIFNFLKSLLDDLKFSRLKFEIFIIDNGSKDSTLDILEKFKNKIKLIKLDKNYGTTYPRNLALRKSTGKYTLIIDSDTIILKYTIKKLIAAFKEIKSKKIGIIHPLLLNPDNTFQSSVFRFPSFLSKFSRMTNIQFLREKFDLIPGVLSKKPCKVEYAISACWIFKRELLDKIGFFDEKIFYSPEDAEFCARIWENGYQVWYYTKAKVIHFCQRLSRKRILGKLFFSHLFGLIYFWNKFKIKKLRKKINL